MKRFIVFVILLLAVSVFAQDKKPEPDKPLALFSATEQQELDALLAQVKNLAPQIEKTEKEILESALYQKLDALKSKRQAAINRIESIVNRACGEAGIKPSECEATADGKGLKRKVPTLTPPQTPKPD